MDFLLHFIGKTGLPPGEAAMHVRIITQTLQKKIADGEEISLPGLGKFTVVEKAARPGRNPRTGEAMTIAPRKTVKFLPSKTLKDMVN